MHSSWRCADCGEVAPFHVARHISTEIIESVLRRPAPTVERLPLWCPWPLPPGWMVTGVGWAGGYVGNGLSATNLAGRTLRDLVLDSDTELRRLAWTDRRVRRWEPEPLRWLGVRAMYVAYRTADRRESARRSARTSRIARLADIVSGR